MHGFRIRSQKATNRDRRAQGNAHEGGLPQPRTILWRISFRKKLGHWSGFYYMGDAKAERLRSAIHRDGCRQLRFTLYLGSRITDDRDKAMALQRMNARSYKSHKYWQDVQRSKHPFDTRFVFDRPEKTLWEQSSHLKLASPYWMTMFSVEGFVENQIFGKYIGSHTKDGDSTVYCSRAFYTIRVAETEDYGLDTYSAVLAYTRSSKIEFGPVQDLVPPAWTNGSNESKNDSATSSTPVASTSLVPTGSNAAFRQDDHSSVQPPCPKQTYRLAHFLELPEVMKLACDEYTKQISVYNVVPQFFSLFAWQHKEVSAMLVDYILANRQDPIVGKHLTLAENLMNDGRLPVPDHVAAALLIGLTRKMSTF